MASIVCLICRGTGQTEVETSCYICKGSGKYRRGRINRQTNNNAHLTCRNVETCYKTDDNSASDTMQAYQCTNGTPIYAKL